jgi:hypothetical protein
MQVEIIKNKKQYEKALQRFEEIFLAKNDSKEGKQSQILALAIKDYESKQFKFKIEVCPHFMHTAKQCGYAYSFVFFRNFAHLFCKVKPNLFRFSFCAVEQSLQFDFSFLM